MRRIVVVATALAVLTTAAAAYAATGGFNTYTASVKVSPNKAGSITAPAAIAFTEKYVASGTNGNRTAPLTDIKSVVYGVVNEGKGFPTCTLAKIARLPSATRYAPRARSSLPVRSPRCSARRPIRRTAPGVLPCNPLLHAYNGGAGKVVYFFVDVAPDHGCAGGAIQTGFVGPFDGTIKIVGKNLLIDTPIPNYVSFPLAGVEGSLTSETLNWLKVTRKVNGKTVAYSASVSMPERKASVQPQRSPRS